jgi:hypothetical protein
MSMFGGQEKQVKWVDRTTREKFLFVFYRGLNKLNQQWIKLSLFPIIASLGAERSWEQVFEILIAFFPF